MHYYTSLTIREVLSATEALSADGCTLPLQNVSSAYLRGIVHSATSSFHCLRSSTDSTHTFTVPRTRTKLTADRSFFISDPTACNSIRLHIRQLTETVAFKRQLNLCKQ